MDTILVYCELDGSRVAEVSLELLSKGRELADTLGVSLEAVALGENLASVAGQVFPYGVDKLHLFDDARLSPYTTLPHASALEKFIGEEKPQIFLLGAQSSDATLVPASLRHSVAASQPTAPLSKLATTRIRNVARQ